MNGYRWRISRKNVRDQKMYFFSSPILNSHKFQVKKLMFFFLFAMSDQNMSVVFLLINDAFSVFVILNRKRLTRISESDRISYNSSDFAETDSIWEYWWMFTQNLTQWMIEVFLFRQNDLWFCAVSYQLRILLHFINWVFLHFSVSFSLAVMIFKIFLYPRTMYFYYIIPIGSVSLIVFHVWNFRMIICWSFVGLDWCCKLFNGLRTSDCVSDAFVVSFVLLLMS